MNGKMHKVEICTIQIIQLRKLTTEMTGADMANEDIMWNKG